MLKKLTYFLIAIWLIGLVSATVCLALDQHSCCPTQTADWHSDTAANAISVKVFVDYKSFEKIATKAIVLLPQFRFVQISFDLPPPTSLLSSINHQVHAPPSA